jgi:prepilin peptidase CpaA
MISKIHMISAPFGWIFVVFCLIGALTDVLSRKIPNALCAVLFLAGLAFELGPNDPNHIFSHLLFAVTALAVGAGLFALHWIGAGDAKFFAGAAIWFRLDQAPLVLICVSGAGVMLFAIWFFYRRARGLAISRHSSSSHDQLPYGVAIAAGMIAAFQLLP